MKWLRRQNSLRPAQWFARIRSGGIDPQSSRAFTDWMEADAVNSQAYENLELAWELSEELRNRPRIRELLSDLEVAVEGDRAARTKAVPFGLSPSRRAGFAIAALILVCAVTAFFVWNRPSTAEYATGVGEQRIVQLADNSTISLNTDTRIQVRLSRASRRIELLGGEALFSVAKDSERPFEVHALHGTTTAVGTEFDVQITGAAASVSVLKGTVTVQSTEKPRDGGPAQISAGQAVDYTTDGTTSAIRSADTDKVRAWQAHRIVFTDVSLADALTDYNRYIKIPIVIGDAALASRHINGVFRIGDQAAFLGALEQGLQVTATQTDSAIVLQPRLREAVPQLMALVMVDRRLRISRSGIQQQDALPMQPGPLRESAAAGACSGGIMSILAWIVLGLIAGFIGSKLINKTGEGVFLDIVLGIVGAVVGGWVFHFFGSTGVTGLNVYSLIVAVIGSMIVLILYHALRRAG